MKLLFLTTLFMALVTSHETYYDESQVAQLNTAIGTVQLFLLSMLAGKEYAILLTMNDCDLCTETRKEFLRV